jgi:hypothetical protein
MKRKEFPKWKWVNSFSFPVEKLFPSPQPARIFLSPPTYDVFGENALLLFLSSYLDSNLTVSDDQAASA